MPSTYAHNKFGKLVIAKLSGRHKRYHTKISDSFRIGLQGPDFLFFYRAFYINKINQTGVKHHRQDVYDFMEHAVSVIKKYGKTALNIVIFWDLYAILPLTAIAILM